MKNGTRIFGLMASLLATPILAQAVDGMSGPMTSQFLRLPDIKTFNGVPHIVYLDRITGAQVMLPIRNEPADEPSLGVKGVNMRVISSTARIEPGTTTLTVPNSFFSPLGALDGSLAATPADGTQRTDKLQPPIAGPSISPVDPSGTERPGEGTSHSPSVPPPGAGVAIPVKGHGAATVIVKDVKQAKPRNAEEKPGRAPADKTTPATGKEYDYDVTLGLGGSSTPPDPATPVAPPRPESAASAGVVTSAGAMGGATATSAVVNGDDIKKVCDIGKDLRSDLISKDPENQKAYLKAKGFFDNRMKETQEFAKDQEKFLMKVKTKLEKDPKTMKLLKANLEAKADSRIDDQANVILSQSVKKEFRDYHTLSRWWNKRMNGFKISKGSDVTFISGNDNDPRAPIIAAGPDEFHSRADVARNFVESSSQMKRTLTYDNGPGKGLVVKVCTRFAESKDPKKYERNQPEICSAYDIGKGQISSDDLKDVQFYTYASWLRERAGKDVCDEHVDEPDQKLGQNRFERIKEQAKVQGASVLGKIKSWFTGAWEKVKGFFKKLGGKSDASAVPAREEDGDHIEPQSDPSE